MIDEEIDDDADARRMLEILSDVEAAPELRAEAAIKLGPGLQLCDERLDWDDLDLFFGEAVFEEIDGVFRRLYFDAGTPELVRRRILEAAVRAPMDWHEGAVRAAWAAEDDEWRQTAIFGMGHLPGFEGQLLKILNGEERSEEVLREAVRAAGARGLTEAEPIVRGVALEFGLDIYTRQVAIEALIWCGNDKSEKALDYLSQVATSDIADTAEWALEERRMFGGIPDVFDDFDDDLY
jgi:hypothetical protein